MSEKERKIIDRHGKTWTISKVSWAEAEERDFEFWFDGLTPEERVDAVDAALESCEKTQGGGWHPETTKSSSPR